MFQSLSASQKLDAKDQSLLFTEYREIYLLTSNRMYYLSNENPVPNPLFDLVSCTCNVVTFDFEI